MQFARLGVLAMCAALSACSVLDSEKIDYKSASKGSSLEVPPDLTQLSRDSRYQVPGGPVTASSFQVGQAAPALPTAASTLGDVRIERAGTQRWLVVNRSADQLWNPIREFWQESGFLLALDESNLGIMETDWAENRAKIPQDFIRNTLGKLIDSVYSTSERDRFRTRLERTPTGGTEIYISHRGMVEVYSTKEKDQTVWQPRPADAELETEFLRRLMVKLGVSEAQSQAVAASAPVQAAARVTMVNNAPVVQFDDNFDRAWRRVGLSLDRTGFTVEDRDRSKGIYFVRYVEPVVNAKDPGFFSKLFGATKTEASTARYRVTVRSTDNKTAVSVLDGQGQPDGSANAQRIAKLLAEDLK